MTNHAALNTASPDLGDRTPSDTSAGPRFAANTSSANKLTENTLTAKHQLWLTKRFQVLASSLGELKVDHALVFSVQPNVDMASHGSSQAVLLWQSHNNLEQPIHNAKKLVQMCLQRQKTQLYSDQKSSTVYLCFSNPSHLSNELTLYFVFTHSQGFSKDDINIVKKTVDALFFYDSDVVKKTVVKKSSHGEDSASSSVKASANLHQTHLHQSELSHRLAKVLDSNHTLTDVSFLIANIIKEHISCESVVISLPAYRVFFSNAKTRINNSIIAISDSKKFDDHSALVKQYSLKITNVLEQQESSNNIQTTHLFQQKIVLDHQHTLLEGIVITVKSELGDACILVINQPENPVNEINLGNLAFIWQDLGTRLLIRQYLQLSSIKKFGLAFFNNTTLLQHQNHNPIKHGFWENLANWQKRVLFAILMVAIFGILNIPMPLTISTKAEIISDSQRALIAPVDGFIKDSHFKAGDQVKTGHLLATLDDKDLNLEKQKLENELQEYDKLYRKELAEFNQVQAKIVKNQREQTLAKIELVNERLSRLKIKAPFDGIILHGDVSQLLGAPVKKGEILFELAPIAEYSLSLQINEKDIHYIREHQSGLLKLFALPSSVIPFTISEVTPIAETVDDRVYFLAHTNWNFNPNQENIIPVLLKPGMTGSAKIETDKLPLWKIMFRDLIRWWQLNRWQLGF